MTFPHFQCFFFFASGYVSGHWKITSGIENRSPENSGNVRIRVLTKTWCNCTTKFYFISSALKPFFSHTMGISTKIVYILYSEHILQMVSTINVL